ncbi:hypothetical protein IBTHAUMO2_1050002 [Nitrosopumilaceae archaeon]|nr:hypothetical protein IBTHAUMO2_1050002 [Nitrosopumilaceae archaeon]
MSYNPTRVTGGGSRGSGAGSDGQYVKIDRRRYRHRDKPPEECSARAGRGLRDGGPARDRHPGRVDYKAAGRPDLPVHVVGIVVVHDAGVLKGAAA